ncbi:MAG TPA: MBL fold metallo-hydrolase [Vicinamibacterales bacterium]|nr:MBL fold metallo-hydrolase [Vicinamibacterales bacterium]
MPMLVLALLLILARPCDAAVEAEITYLGHSGWLVQADRVLLLFDYIGEDARAAAALEESLDTNDGLSLIVLVTHEHSDHYRPSVLKALAARLAAPEIGIAFLPAASGNAACTQSHSLITGGVIATTLLQPAVVVPMHARCVERRADLFGAFGAAIARVHPHVEIVVAGRTGFRHQVRSHDRRP